MLDVASRIVLVERGRITRNCDVGAVQGGAIAELVGLGGARGAYRGYRRRRCAPGLVHS